MEKLLRIGIYDQIGYIFVGGLVVMLFALDGHFIFPAWHLPNGGFTNLLVVFFAAYVLGHLVQATANMIIKEKKSDFSPEVKHILEDVIAEYGLHSHDYNGAFKQMMSLAKWKDLTGEVGAFNAHYGLYRGWALVFFLNAMAASYYILTHLNIASHEFWGFNIILSLFASYAFLRRSKRFYAYFGEKVVSTYLLVKHEIE